MKKHLNINNYWINILVVAALSAVLSAIGVLLSDVADMVNVRRYLQSPLLFLLNTIPLTLFMLLLYHLTSRIWVSFSFGGGLFLIMQIVNRFMMQLREEPFTFADLLLGTEAANVVVFSELPINLTVIFSCVFWILMSLLLYFFVRSRKLRLPVKAAGVLAAVGLFTLSFLTVYKDTKLYDSFEIRGSIYSRVNQFKSRGFMYSFLVRAGSFKSIKPENYSRTDAENTLQQYEKTEEGQNGVKRPHVIAVMGEAFYDIDRIPGIEFNDGYYPLENFHRISRQAYSGRIVTNVFGGGTANTEFAFLTGHSMAIMPEMSSPYISYIRKDTSSLARVFEKAGYATMAFHPGDSWFYNRLNVYHFFGFDQLFFKNSMDLDAVETNNGYISDRDTAEFLLDKFRAHVSENPDQPLFEFTVNIDNHGPYSKNDLGYLEILKRQDTMDDSAYNMINNYLNGLLRCDKALGYLADTIGSLDEPVVLLYFADHLPYLGENYQGFKALGFDIGGDKGLEAYLNLYETPYFIWCNPSAAKLLSDNQVSVPTGTAPEISANYLATELLDYIGLDGGAYYNYLSELKQTLPVITTRFYKEDGSFTEDLSQESRQMLEQYKELQYYMMMDYDKIQ